MMVRLYVVELCLYNTLQDVKYVKMRFTVTVLRFALHLNILAWILKWEGSLHNLIQLGNSFYFKKRVWWENPLKPFYGN